MLSLMWAMYWGFGNLLSTRSPFIATPSVLLWGIRVRCLTPLGSNRLHMCEATRCPRWLLAQVVVVVVVPFFRGLILGR
eukprot:3017068-Pyramimonas_sp.AAC.1